MCGHKNQDQIHSKNPPEGTNLVELDKKRPRTPQLSGRFGLNFTPSAFALQQSIRLVFVYTCSELYPETLKGTRRRDQEHTQSTARQRRHNTTQQPRDSNGGNWPLSANGILLPVLVLTAVCWLCSRSHRSCTCLTVTILRSVGRRDKYPHPRHTSILIRTTVLVLTLQQLQLSRFRL